MNERRHVKYEMKTKNGTRNYINIDDKDYKKYDDQIYDAARKSPTDSLFKKHLLRHSNEITTTKQKAWPWIRKTNSRDRTLWGKRQRRRGDSFPTPLCYPARFQGFRRRGEVWVLFAPWITWELGIFSRPRVLWATGSLRDLFEA